MSKKFIAIYDVWKVVDIQENDISNDVISLLENFGVVYRDNSDLSEHLLSPREAIENSQQTKPLLPEYLEELENLAEILDEKDAFYLRIVKI